MDRKWVPDTFEMRCLRGGGATVTVPVDGWVCHPFAVDKRYCDGDADVLVAWCITHLPTGYAAKFVIGKRSLAQKVANALAAACDWDFTDPAHARKIGKDVRAAMQAFPSDIFAESDVVFPATRSRTGGL